MRAPSLRNGRSLLVAALTLWTCAGCAFSIVHPPPLVVTSPETGTQRTVEYPAYVLVHDSSSFWDAHQIKDNITGLFDGEIVRWIDLPFDAVIPGPPRRPVRTGIEWVKNSYAQLPDYAPVRIVGGFFGALEIDKLTVGNGARIATAPVDPLSYTLFTRVIYLTDWMQDTLGEVNTGLGYLVPWPGPFIPYVVTNPINSGVDWAQDGTLTAYIYVFRKISVGLDDALYGGEWAWGKLVSVFVPKGEPVNQEP